MSDPRTLAPNWAQASVSDPVPTKGSRARSPSRTPPRLAMRRESCGSMVVLPMKRRDLSERRVTRERRPSPTQRPKKQRSGAEGRLLWSKP